MSKHIKRMKKAKVCRCNCFKCEFYYECILKPPEPKKINIKYKSIYEEYEERKNDK